VRSLAQRAAQAAREIKTLIGASEAKVESGSELVQQAGSTMSEVVVSVQRVAHIVADITQATGEQSGGLSEVNSAVAQLDQVTQQNAALVEESAAAAQSMQTQAEQLEQLVRKFRLGAGEPAALRRAAPKPMPAPLPRSQAAPAQVPGPERAKVSPPPVAKPAALAQPSAAKPSAKVAAGQEDDWETF